MFGELFLNRVFAAMISWVTAKDGVVTAVRYISLHTGIPALVVAAILIVVGYRLLKKTARFVVEVAAIGLVLVAASELGWLRW